MGLSLYYQEQLLPADAALRTVGPSTAFVKTKIVMPVGTRLQIQEDDGPRVPVFVIRAVDEVDAESGIFVQADLKDDGAKWWASHAAQAEDFVFPEGGEAAAGQSESSPAPERDNTRQTMQMSGDDLAQVFASGPPESADLDGKPKPKGKQGRNKKKKKSKK